MDFTIKTYEKLVDTLVNADYEFITFEQYCNGIRPHKFIMLLPLKELFPRTVTEEDTV